MIPRIIHQITGPKANTFINDCLKSWQILQEEGFEIRIWTDELLEQFIISTHPFAMNAFLTARNHGEAADIARYLIIYHFGGYYVDWDIKLFNTNEFLKLHSIHQDGYLLLDPLNGTIASEYFSSKSGDQFLKNLSLDIVDTFERGERDLMSTPCYSGPYRMRFSINKHPSTKLSIIPVKNVFEYDYAEIRNANFENKPRKAMIHYWAHSWVS